MIKLEVKNYCHNCDEFDPDVEVSIGEKMYQCVDYGFTNKMRTKRKINTVVTCKHKLRCESMFNYVTDQTVTEIKAEKQMKTYMEAKDGND